jgi:enoyl-CoA hydratase
MNSNDPVLIDRRAGFAVLTLNRPQAMNALSEQLRCALSAAIDDLETDPAVRVLVLTGAGKAFCGGLDLKELGSIQGPMQTLLQKLSTRQDPVALLRRFPGPVIGAINGPAITGGFELALGCDVLIASTEARFADTHARVGLLPCWGLSQHLSRLIGPSRAKELHFTGNFLTAEQACSWGLVSRVVAPDQLLSQACALAQDMVSMEPATLQAYKALIDDGYRVNFGSALTLERERSVNWAANVTAEQIEERRRAIRDRGREQKDSTSGGH